VSTDLGGILPEFEGYLRDRLLAGKSTFRTTPCAQAGLSNCIDETGKDREYGDGALEYFNWPDHIRFEPACA
jgi:hypothetical protein